MLYCNEFNSIAAYYYWLELFSAGPLLQQARMSFIGEISAKRMLLAGEGHGQFLLPLGSHYPDAEVTYLDASDKMLDVARRRLKRANPAFAERVVWLHAGLPDTHLPVGHFDLIATNFFLDCFEGDHLQRVVDSLSKASSPEGQWVNTDFTVPENPMSGTLARIALWSMYRLFQAMAQIPAKSLQCPSPTIRSCGFELKKESLHLCGFVRSQLWQRHQREMIPCPIAYNG
jgi:ubiquinone/menaquinone biosynthesis C-methylase UbiE